MQPSAVDLQQRTQAWAKRDSRLQKTSFAATIVAVILFFYVAYLVEREIVKLKDVQSRYAVEMQKYETLRQENARLQQANAVQSLAASAAKESRRVKAHVVYYRASEKDIVQGALEALGFRVEQDSGVRTLSSAANAIAYGAQVDPEEVRLVASTLVKSGFKLVSIRPAARRGDDQLIQVYSTRYPEREYDLDAVRQWRK